MARYRPTSWMTSSGAVITPRLVEQAYALLPSNEPGQANAFFESIGAGHGQYADQPYERLRIYEYILEIIHNLDSTKYDFIHKGTPYYFMYWTAFDVEDYEKAIFYLDAAVSEDYRLDNNTWQHTPAGTLLLLNTQIDGPAAKHITEEVESSISRHITRFNQLSGATFSVQSFINQYVMRYIGQVGFRSMISALYVFILEYTTRKKQMTLRSSAGGSIEPFLLHLFKGCLVFESQLKRHYYSAQNPTRETLGKYLEAARKDLGLPINPLWSVRNRPKTIPDILPMLPIWSNEAYEQKILAVTYALRNTAGHDLSWPDTFTTATYEELFESVLYSIFWAIWKLEI